MLIEDMVTDESFLDELLEPVYGAPGPFKYSREHLSLAVNGTVRVSHNPGRRTS